MKSAALHTEVFNVFENKSGFVRKRKYETADVFGILIFIFKQWK